MPIKQIIESSRVPVKIWTNDVDEGSVRQLKNVICRLYFIMSLLCRTFMLAWARPSEA